MRHQRVVLFPRLPSLPRLRLLRRLWVLPQLRLQPQLPSFPQLRLQPQLWSAMLHQLWPSRAERCQVTLCQRLVRLQWALQLAMVRLVTLPLAAVVLLPALQPTVSRSAAEHVVPPRQCRLTRPLSPHPPLRLA